MLKRYSTSPRILQRVLKPFNPDRLHIAPSRSLVGTVSMPGDKSITLRALLCAALADGESTLRGVSSGHDAHSLIAALSSLGVSIDRFGEKLKILGWNRQLPDRATPVSLGSSPTSLRLLSGLLAGCSASVTLELETRSDLRFDPLAETLARVGVSAKSAHRDGRPAIVIRGGVIREGDVSPAVVSAQLKSVLLLAGVQLDKGWVRVAEERPTRNHTEELLRLFGAQVEVEDEVTTVVHSSQLRAVDYSVPGDPSHAAYWLVAAATVPGSDITVCGVHTGRRRAAYIEVLQQMGSDVAVAEDGRSVRARFGPTLRPVRVEVDRTPALLDEIPVLALAAARADGETTISGVHRVRRGTANRVVATVELLRMLGVEVRGDDELLTIIGRPAGLLVPKQLQWHGDHHLGLTAVIAAVSSTRGAVVPQISLACAAYPEFLDHLEVLAS